MGDGGEHLLMNSILTGANALDAIGVHRYSMSSRVFLPRSRNCAAGGRTVLLASWRALSATTGDWSRHRASLDGAHWEGRVCRHRAFVGRSAAEPERSDDHTGEHQKDPVAACYRFNLRDDQARRVEGLGQQQLSDCGKPRRRVVVQASRRLLALLDAPQGFRFPCPPCASPGLWPRSQNPGR
jgi:hypothetical protein